MRGREIPNIPYNFSSSGSIDSEKSDVKDPLILPHGIEEASNKNIIPSMEDIQVDFLKLVWGAGGIYAAYLYYGSIQEDVFSYVDKNGVGFKQAWFLQTLEAFVNVVAGAIGLRISGGSGRMPQKDFMISGIAQVCAKAFTSLGLANGVSYPIATLAKSAKMAPVMAGSLLLGGTVYSIREYLQVLAIISGTVIVNLGNKKGGTSGSSSMGVMFICLSLLMDGVVGGTQKRLKSNFSLVGIKPKPYDFMFYTNLYMMISGVIISFLLGDFFPGLTYCVSNPGILNLILKFSICSAVGQSFIFYTVSHFDPLVCSTVTTTRKIFTVLISIIFKGHQLGITGWSGVSIAISGIVCEAVSKYASVVNKKKTTEQL